MVVGDVLLLWGVEGVAAAAATVAVVVVVEEDLEEEVFGLAPTMSWTKLEACSDISL